jgi:hypothetical protein
MADQVLHYWDEAGHQFCALLAEGRDKACSGPYV